MKHNNPKPTVIGSGLTGVLISLALSKAQIEHVLIGGPPPVGSPRLGESLTMEATNYFLHEFPELADHHYEKRFGKLYAGKQISSFDFSYLGKPRDRVTEALWGKAPENGLIHIDRIHIDAILYERAINSPYCTHIDARVQQLDLAPDGDTIQQLILQGGETLPVSHVFDATGYIRLLARELMIPRRMLGPTQQIVYTHYHRDAAMAMPRPDADWFHATNILRLYRERDGFDGLAWCIPLGDTVSVGVSTPSSSETLAAEEYLTRAQELYARYGANYGAQYTIPSAVKHARAEFYTHSRAHGANWLLTSAAHTQIWWPTSSGLDTSATAAHSAVPFLRQPQRTGLLYQSYMASLVPQHDVWNWVAAHPYGAATVHRIRKRTKQVFSSTSKRHLKSRMLAEQHSLSRAMKKLTLVTWNDEISARLPMPLTFSNGDVGDNELKGDI